jgi:hypothetical protein
LIPPARIYPFARPGHATDAILQKVQAMGATSAVILVPGNGLGIFARQAAVELTDTGAFLEGFSVEGDGLPGVRHGGRHLRALSSHDVFRNYVVRFVFFRGIRGIRGASQW